MGLCKNFLFLTLLWQGLLEPEVILPGSLQERLSPGLSFYYSQSVPNSAQPPLVCLRSAALSKQWGIWTTSAPGYTSQRPGLCQWGDFRKAWWGVRWGVPSWGCHTSPDFTGVACPENVFNPDGPFSSQYPAFLLSGFAARKAEKLCSPGTRVS